MIRTSSGIQWAAGMSVSGVPDNPYPADIINPAWAARRFAAPAIQAWSTH
jgi:hypothetical protein